MNPAINNEHIPIPLTKGTTFQTSRGPNLEYCEIVSSRKNNGRPIRNNMHKKAITNAPIYLINELKKYTYLGSNYKILIYFLRS